MKVRDSGMPEEEWWTAFFKPEEILETFGIEGAVGNLVDFGCGYGTFTLAAARVVSETVYALDIEQEMVALVREKCAAEGIGNVQPVLVDFVKEGTGLPENFADAALLFNILHYEAPVVLIREAFRILKTGGRLAVVHWNHDPTTPRGPAMDIRPHPEQCIEWAKEAGFTFDEQERFDLRPYHYGLLFRKQL